MLQRSGQLAQIALHELDIPLDIHPEDLSMALAEAALVEDI
ncbi:MAG: hypothetical protein WBB73_16590 [Candidatus Aminicenantaceae bacterium]